MRILTNENSILNNFLLQIRDKELQRDREKFRTNLQRIGEIMAYEISKDLAYKAVNIETVLGTKTSFILDEDIVLVAVLRAAIPMYNGFLTYFQNAETTFIGAYRKSQDKDDKFEIELDYLAGPAIENKTIIIIDPMIATGKSIWETYRSITKLGKPIKVIIAGAIASEIGVNLVQKEIPNCKIYLADLDKELNSKAYIIPGLGDAGDLAFGEKI